MVCARVDVELYNEVEHLSEIRWDKVDWRGMQILQHLGKWMVDSRAGWYVILGSYRARQKHYQWGPPKYALSRWRKEGTYYRKWVDMNLRPDVMDVLGTGGVMSAAQDDVRSVLDRVGCDALENVLFLPDLPGDDM